MRYARSGVIGRRRCAMAMWLFSDDEPEPLRSFPDIV
jgi:hypothetical protein